MPDSTTPNNHGPPKPAGGWGALRSSANFVRDSGSAIRSAFSLLRMNKPGGFDCPGCAWPDPNQPSIAEFCENGVKALTAETTAMRVTPAFFAKHPVADLAKQSDHWLENQGRLTEPMAYEPSTDRYRPIPWGQAFTRIGKALNQLGDPNQAIFYTSGRTSNEAAFLYQLFGRLYGTNNFPDCSNMCHESSGIGLTESIGTGKGTVSLADFESADAIFILGQNPGTNHPRMLTELQKARKRGAHIVTFNPIVERGLESFIHPQNIGELLTGKATPMSSLYLQPLIGGDLAALKGVMKWILHADQQADSTVINHSFIREHTTGYTTFVEDLNLTDWKTIETQSGLTRDQLKQAADIYCRAQASIICWAMGLTQHRHAVATIQVIANLLLLRGNLGRPGAGACPVRGHSNVQGDRTVGITENPPPALVEGLRKVFRFEPPAKSGFSTVDAIRAMAEGQAQVFVGMGGNFASATPDRAFTERALQACKLTVHVSTKLNRSHIVHGEQALILPCLGRTEIDMQTTGPQSITVEDSMSCVHASSGRNSPASKDLRSEPAIVAGIAKATLKNSPVDWDELVADYSRIRDCIEQVLPAFAGYNEKIQRPGGFTLRNSAGHREWNTQSGKANFIVHSIPDLTLPDGQLRLMTIRSHDQYNTTIYGMDDRYRGIKETRLVIFMNGSDILDRSLKSGQRVDLVSHFEDGIKRRANNFQVVEYDIPRGCAAAYFPETNVLVSVNSYAKKSMTPTSKFIPVTVQKP